MNVMVKTGYSRKVLLLDLAMHHVVIMIRNDERAPLPVVIAH